MVLLTASMGSKIPKWPVLKESLRVFSVASMSILQGLVSEGAKVPVRREMMPVRMRDNQWSFETKEIPLYGVLLQERDNNLKALSEYQKCESFLLQEEETASHINKLVGTPHHSVFLSVERILNAVLLDQLADGYLGFGEDKFEQTYKKVEEYFSSQLERFAAWVPLKNFTTDIEEISIDPGVSSPVKETVSKENFGFQLGPIRGGREARQCVMGPLVVVTL